jgi:hypothetical protein
LKLSPEFMLNTLSRMKPIVIIVIARKWYGSTGAVESVWTYTLSKFSPDPSIINRKVFGYIPS